MAELLVSVVESGGNKCVMESYDTCAAELATNGFET